VNCVWDIEKIKQKKFADFIEFRYHFIVRLFRHEKYFIFKLNPQIRKSSKKIKKERGRKEEKEEGNEKVLKCPNRLKLYLGCFKWLSGFVAFLR
jgi:hypothetical protein